MKHGRTSIVDFLSQAVLSFSGFIATIILTRTLGQDGYGTYVVILSVLSWAILAGNLGVGPAVKKRVSESTEGNYVLAGAISQVALYAVVVVLIWLFRHRLNAFVGMDVASAFIVMLGVKLLLRYVRTVLDGQHRVHISSILSPVEWTIRSVIQVALVLSGFGIAGALLGYVAGAIVAAIIGFYFVDIPRMKPTRHEFERLRSFAQFSWLASFKGRTFLSMDTIILAIFVSHSLVGIYEVAWNLASLFAIFGRSITRTLFPEMSTIATDEDNKGKIIGLLRTSLAYSGLFIIPGLVGSALLGDIVLTIYGEGFETGYYILLVLTFARLLYGYKKQFLNVIDAVDRPELSFQINAVFIGANLVLNVVLTSAFGWYGAATATTASAAIGLVLGYYYVRRTLGVEIPSAQVAYQCVSAAVMAIAVVAGRFVLPDSIPVAVLLAGVGAVVYFTVLLWLSKEFRTTVEDNLGFSISDTFIVRG